MKKIIAGIFAAGLFCLPVSAHPPVTVLVDGQALSFDQPPIIQDDRVLVPMRAIFQALGAEVYWEESTQTVTALSSADTMQFRIGDAGLYKNGALAYTMAVPAQIVNDRTLVPIRAIAEGFGAAVGWDEAGYTVTIQSNGQAAALPTGTPTGTAQAVQGAPEIGGFSAEVRAEDGTAVLSVKLECDTLEGIAGAERINTLMAEAAFAEGQGFLRAYCDAALRAYAAQPEGFQPYYYVGSYRLMREKPDYISFLASLSRSTGAAETAQYASYTYSAAGREVSPAEIFDDSQSELEELWRAGFLAMLAEEPDAFYKDAETRLERSLGSVGFYLTESGAVFYLPPETIAPAEAGLVAFEVPYDF